MRRLGFGFGQRISGGGVSGSGRSRSLVAAAAANVGKKIGTQSGSESESKNLYLCFVEKIRSGAGTYINHVVRKLNSTDDDGDDEFLPEATYEMSSEVSNTHWRHCTRIGSQIGLPIGTHDRITDLRLIKFPNLETKLQSFSSPKNDPLLVGGSNGQLYCIDNAPYLAAADDPKADHHPFEVLDSQNKNNLDWRPLDPPPFINGFRPNPFLVSFLEGSNKILGWECRKKGVYCFDTTNPENGWTESSFSLANTLPFRADHRRPLPFFIRDHHPQIGAFHIMFIYNYIYSRVIFNFMTDYCDSFQIIQGNCPQQQFRKEFYHYYSNLPISDDFEFVHLGGQKVCLVLNHFFPQDHAQHENTGILQLITFEYEIQPTILNPDLSIYLKPTIYIVTRWLSTRRFRYHSRQLSKQGRTKTESVRMSGAFLL